jgi:hypothetical protein
MAQMKTHNIELQKVKGQSFAHGLIKLHVDTLITPAVTPEDKMPTSTLLFTEETARVLLSLLKTQLLELDGKKAKSRHGR